MSLRARIETVANIATIGVAVVVSAVLIKVYLLPAPTPRRPQVLAETGVGTSLKGRVPGVDWSRNGRTLVLAVSTQCHFCKESTPFYRKLQEQVGKSLKTVAILPQSVAAAEQYLNGESVHVDQVRQVTLGDIGIRATPTMLLVNSAGVVTKIWVGRIKPEQEQDVLTALRKG
jgi:hypothetical protein